MGKKLFGSSGSGRYKGGRSATKTRPAKAVNPKKWKVLSILLAIILFLECAYCVVIFTDLIPPVAKLRQAYIETAMTTLNHKWLAKALIPGDIVQDVVDRMAKAQMEQSGLQSSWTDVAAKETTEPVEVKSPASGFSKDQAAAILGQIAEDSGMDAGASQFLTTFHELDEESVYAWVDAHPETIANGWDKFYVNEAGLDDEGTTMYTKQGDQVLAVNAEHGLLAIRIQNGIQYRGVLVIGKDASRLKCAPSAIDGAGQRVGQIGADNNGLVAMTASGFRDAPNVAEGGDMEGGAMYSGESVGYHFPWGYKRIELHTDNRLYITDAHTDYMDGCTDACEFTPALIVDGKIVVSAADGYTAMNPRCCIGQTKDEAIMFLMLEGRLIDSIGTDANECAEILARYNCYQALNVDGGTSGMLWYEDEYIVRCSNTSLPEGRRLPNAWVYCKETVPDPS